jgi:hypothetical protein
MATATLVSLEPRYALVRNGGPVSILASLKDGVWVPLSAMRNGLFHSLPECFKLNAECLLALDGLRD